MVLERPGIGLHGALRIRMPAEVQERAADGVVARDGHQLLQLLAVEQLPAKAAALADLGRAPSQGELRVGERDANPVGLMLGGIAEQLVHLGPEALLFETERAVDMGGAAAIPSGGFPSDDALVEHEDVDAGAGQPPAGAETGHSAADDDDCRTRRLGHRVPLYRDGEPDAPYVRRPYSRFRCQSRLSEP